MMQKLTRQLGRYEFPQMIPWSRFRRSLWAITLGMSVVMAIATPALFAQEARIGLTVEGSQTFNQATLTTVSYTGQCPGTSSPQAKAWFSSSTTPPRDGLRVLIQNVSQGMDPEKQPYTDREYDEGTVSEYTIVEFGTSHSSRTFRVLDGENTFNYEIRDRAHSNVVVESGTFTATFDHLQQSEVRDATCQTQSNVCANSAVSQSVCADLRSRTQCTCPNGNVISTEFSPTGPVRTMISNQTEGGISYRMNGRVSYLASGEDRWIEGNVPGSITFEDGSGSNRTQALTAGTRYRFTYSSSGTLQLSPWQR
jgi:hypothetical protein